MTVLRHRSVDALKIFTPASARRWLVGRRFEIRQAIPVRRVLPDFLIIGALRSGTSSLYKYLGRHPDVAPSLRKEVGYFTFNYQKGEMWYRSHFPVALRSAVHERLRGQQLLSFEATPDYLFDARAPGRAVELVPEAKLVVLLRNPVDRAYSHYLHMKRLGFEELAFEDALKAEESRVAEDLERLQANSTHPAKSLRRFSYVARGKYAEQLLGWWRHFGPDRFLVLRSEDFFESPSRIVRAVTDFVDVPPWLPRSFSNYSYVGSVPSTSPMDDDVRRHLHSTFIEHNDHLAELLGRDMKWGR